VEAARRIAKGVRNQFRYLLWLYSESPLIRRIAPAEFRITFKLGASLGEATLSVRCNDGSDAFIFSEVFEHRYYDVLLPMTPATILDVGANIGLTAVFFRRKFPSATIVCVEPMPNNAEILERNIRQNHLDITVIEKALCVHDKPVTMVVANKDYGHRVFGIKNSDNANGATIEVPGVTVSSLLESLRWQRIGLLKLDIEGYEATLLRENAEWLRSVDAICLECHEPFGIADLVKIAAEHGFQPPRHLPGIWVLIRR
jgi:FkbM family methyltransferase